MEELLGKELYRKITDQISPKLLAEVRIRLNKEVYIKSFDYGFFLDEVGTESLIRGIIDRATHFSRYAYEQEISDGYLSYGSGIRLGIAGEGRVNEQGLTSYRKIFSLCVRIPHEIMGCAAKINDILQEFDNTLIISPPFGGKTTLLRDCARILSCSHDVLLADERYELCGKDCFLKTGSRCDIIQGVPKSAVYENVLRAMNPEIVIFDELFGDDDIRAVERLTKSGIKVMATYHGGTKEDVPPRLLSQFDNIIVLASIPKAGSIVSIVRRNIQFKP